MTMTHGYGRQSMLLHDLGGVETLLSRAAGRGLGHNGGSRQSSQWNCIHLDIGVYL